MRVLSVENRSEKAQTNTKEVLGEIGEKPETAEARALYTTSSPLTTPDTRILSIFTEFLQDTWLAKE